MPKVRNSLQNIVSSSFIQNSDTKWVSFSNCESGDATEKNELFKDVFLQLRNE